MRASRGRLNPRPWRNSADATWPVTVGNWGVIFVFCVCQDVTQRNAVGDGSSRSCGARCEGGPGMLLSFVLLRCGTLDVMQLRLGPGPRMIGPALEMSCVLGGGDGGRACWSMGWRYFYGGRGW